MRPWRITYNVGKTFVGSDESLAMGLSMGKNLSIGVTTQPNVPDVLGKVARLAQYRSGRARHVLVDKKGLQSGDASDLFRGNDLRGIAQCRVDIIHGDPVFVSNFFRRHST